MSRRAVGVALVGFSTFLFGITYLSAALFGSLETPRYWPGDVFRWPIYLAFILLVAGVVYLAWAEIGRTRGQGGSRD